MRRKKYHRAILFCSAMISILSIGFSYAAWTNSNLIATKVTTSILDFIFYSDTMTDFSVELVDVNGGYGYPVSASVSTNGGTLIVDNIQEGVLDAMMRGDSNLVIRYRMVASDPEKGLKHVSPGTYDLGSIPFYLSEEGVHAELITSQGKYDVDAEQLSIFPTLIEGFTGTNNVTNTDDAVVGYITISGIPMGMNNDMVFQLSSMGLPAEVNEAIEENSEGSGSLQVTACYDFHIPLLFDQ